MREEEKKSLKRLTQKKKLPITELIDKHEDGAGCYGDQLFPIAPKSSSSQSILSVSLQYIVSHDF